MQKQTFCLTNFMKSYFLCLCPSLTQNSCLQSHPELPSFAYLYKESNFPQESLFIFLDNSHINYVELRNEKCFPNCHLYTLQVSSKGQTGGVSCLVHSPSVEGHLVLFGPEAPSWAPCFPLGLRETAVLALPGYAQVERIKS